MSSVTLKKRSLWARVFILKNTSLRCRLYMARRWFIKNKSKNRSKIKQWGGGYRRRSMRIRFRGSV